jgi:hypothetical protein
MPEPQVETVETMVRADGWVKFVHPRLGESWEALLSSDELSSIPPSLESCPILGPCPPRAETSAVAAGSSATDAAQGEQYTASEPAKRNESRPQRSQYLVSKTSARPGGVAVPVAVCAASILLFLCEVMHAC